mmetsp:Transcript_58470/g.163033  ORF Transcript_58470/g.163033 Transcript_58470/m.163033 type:complete len:644 (-) Transcript_58470:14-1945(-)
MAEAVAELVDAIKVGARAQLLDLLDEVAGRKVLLLDGTVVGPLDLVVSPGDLKDHGVQNWYKLSDQPVNSDCSQMIFLVRCWRVELMDLIAKQILEDEAQGKDRMYEVVLIPRKTKQCLERLDRGNVRANVRVAEFGLHFFPFDRDILSMEVPGTYHDSHVQGDPTSLFYAAKGIMSLQAQFGVIPTVHAIGSAAKSVLDIMLRLRKEQTASEALKEPQTLRESTQPGVPPIAPHSQQRTQGTTGSVQAQKISEVVLIDRRVDVFSVLCSQFTYQALIDMVFGVHNNSADISSVNFAKDQKSSTIRLAPDDPFYQEIRDLHIDKLGPLLQQRAMSIQKTYAEKDNVKNPSEMQEYIKKFKTAQSTHSQIETHINLAHHLKNIIQDDEYRNQLRIEDDITAQSSQNSLDLIEDYLDDQKPFHEVLRLLCLYSLVNNGIKQKQLDQIKRSIIQSYGYEHLLTLCNLERVGLLRYHQGKSLWGGIKRHFNLFVEDSAAEKDICYAYSGYAPLSVRLVQMTKSRPGGWRSCQDALSLLWGPSQDLKQSTDLAVSEDAREANRPSVVLVVFLGGVTYGEIAALRRLSELEEGRRRFLVVTTEFTNAKKLFESMKCEQVFKQPPVEPRRPKPQEPKRTGGGFGMLGLGR